MTESIKIETLPEGIRIVRTEDDRFNGWLRNWRDRRNGKVSYAVGYLAGVLKALTIN